MGSPTPQSSGKRRWANTKKPVEHGSRGRGRAGKDMGCKEWSRQQRDKRADIDDRNTKRQKTEADGNAAPSILPLFSQEEIEAETRRPKHKVAVLIGYSGSGYKGMQINYTEKTIEGDLFKAFVAAGAISKANANDPKKSALVRCARTDKGVHAAGNVISLKLIDDDPDVVAKINSQLSPQIRVWGIQRTVASFSCYQSCDSRYYEYLIPSHVFLPPNPNSYLARKILDFAEEANDLEEHQKRQDEVSRFWTETEEKLIKPILDDLDASIKDVVFKALYEVENDSQEQPPPAVEDTKPDSDKATLPINIFAGNNVALDTSLPEGSTLVGQEEEGSIQRQEDARMIGKSLPSPSLEADIQISAPADESLFTPATRDSNTTKADPERILRRQAIDGAVKSLREAYMSAKRSYRISPARLDRIEAGLDAFIGTKNFHNYTVAKTFRDPSAMRHIKSFVLDRKPVLINGTEWLSLKIHGQSFMMHQIRKMVSMVALVVRCGCPTSRISDTLGPEVVSIPKAPGLGLLLERPVFDSYNKNVATKFDREEIDFSKHETEMLEFKQREIYERIFREEEQTAAFHVFFNQVDAFKEPQFLYLTSKGLDAVKGLAKTRSAGAVGMPLKGLEADDSESEEGDS